MSANVVNVKKSFVILFISAFKKINKEKKLIKKQIYFINIYKNIKNICIQYFIIFSCSVDICIST